MFKMEECQGKRLKIAIRDLKIEVFGISHEPRTSRSHVTSASSSGLQFEVHVSTAGPRSRGK